MEAIDWENKTHDELAQDLITKFTAYPWCKYDGVVDNSPNEITLNDCMLSLKMKSRFSYKKQRDWPILVLRLKPKIDEILKKYDTSLSLEKDTPEIEAFLKDIDILFNQLIGARYWNVAKLTKALHRKRPKLIPMIDSIVCRKYNNITSQNRSPKDEIINQSIKALYELKNELINHLDDIKKIVNIANNRAPNLVPKNISNLRCLESLVFQQYFN